MNKPRVKSSKSRLSSSRSAISNLGESGNDADVRMTRGANVPPSEIPLIKWREIIDDEEQDFIINSIREDIVRAAMDAIYSRYLKKTSYAFVVDCSHRAWLQFFNFMYLKHDRGENVQTIAEHWSHDKAPDPVLQDSWACRSMTVNYEKLPPQESEPYTTTCSTKNSIGSLISVPSFACPLSEAESSHNLSNTEVLVEKADTSKPDIITERRLSSVGDETSLASLSERQRSIFTRTISMAKANLPVPRRRSQGEFKPTTHMKEKKFHKSTEAVQPPERLDLDALPLDRLDIKYSIVPEHGAKSPSHKNSKTRSLVKK